MHVRMIVTYFKGTMTPKEGHVDYVGLSNETQEGLRNYCGKILDDCFKILCSKHAELDKMLPTALKARQFEIVIHGEYLQGLDFKDGEWVYDKPLFNVLQLGIPENEKPLIKT